MLATMVVVVMVGAGCFYAQVESLTHSCCAPLFVLGIALQIAMAAVIGVPHPKWDERPLLLAVKKEGTWRCVW
jgi:acyl-CoA synthetase (AMP-forming)/AMP-acid ligase II